MERHAHHRQPCHTRDATRVPAKPIRSGSNPIRSQRSAAAGPLNRRSNKSWCTTESINTIKLKDRGERAEWRERKKGQAQRE